MTPQLTIGRMHATYMVPRTRAAPDTLRSRLDPVLFGRFAPACGGAIARMSEQADQSVWIIRHLDVDLGLRVDGVHDDDIAGRWANEVARHIARTLRRGPDGGTVLRFANRAAYVAYFVRQVTERGEWDDTVFPRFHGLKPLPRASAVVTVLTGEPDLIEPVFAILHADNVLDALLDILREDEIDVIVSALGDAAPSMDGVLVATLLPALIDALVPSGSDTFDSRMAVSVLMAARAAGAQGDGATLIATMRQCAHVILRLLRLLRSGVEWAAADVESFDASIQAVPPATRVWLAQPEGRVLFDQVVSALHEKTRAASATVPRARHTPLGGAWLLLPALEMSGADAALGSVTLTPASRAALRCAVLARCVGNAGAAVDEMLFSACGGRGEDDAAAALRRALRQLRCNARSLARMADAANDGDFASRAWRLHRVESTRYEVSIAVDEADGQWRYAAPSSSRQRAEHPHAALTALARLVTRPDLMLLHDSVYPLAGGESVSHDTPSARDAGRDASIARDFAALAGDPCTSLHGENWGQAVALSWLARRVLHAFQRRLPGFDRSSVEHLRRNFLNGEGAITRTEDGFTVVVDPPPLGLVLRIAGWHDAMATPTWLADQHVRYSMSGA